MRSGSNVQLAALRNRDIQLQTTSAFSNHGSVERSTACCFTCLDFSKVHVFLGHPVYGAPCKAKNFNVVYVWTYVWLCTARRRADDIVSACKTRSVLQRVEMKWQPAIKWHLILLTPFGFVDIRFISTVNLQTLLLLMNAEGILKLRYLHCALHMQLVAMF
jgi:hypothetical protein